MNPRHKRPYIIILASLLLLFIAKAYYDTNSIEIKHYEIKNSSPGEALSGLKAAHLSDLHLKTTAKRENKILEILKEEKPDLIFITGDIISFEGPYEPAMSFFHQLRSPLGIYAVLGNTEYSNENGSCVLCHEERSKRLKQKQGPTFLRNSHSLLQFNGKTLAIIGVDDPVNKKSNLKTALKGINSEIPSILLAHSPVIFEEASDSGVGLLLSGHTHGGQIFLTRLMRRIFPLEASLEFIEGFFQKGKMLMYVSRGVGTSYLPFRFGPKPEITFFSFSANSTNPSNPSNPNNSSDLINTVSISNNPSKTIFTGLSLSNLVETFNVFKVFNSLGLVDTRQRRGNEVPQHVSIAAQRMLFDFESEEELKQLNWECHKWLELSKENRTSGRYALKLTLPPGQYPGINFREIERDWSGFRYLKMDVYNPREERVNLHIRIDDNKSGLEYANRFDIDFELKQGKTHISIPTDSIKRNIGHNHPLNLKRIKRMILFLANNAKPREIYIDYIRLE